MKNFADKAVLITGAANGIGLGVAVIALVVPAFRRYRIAS